MGQDDTPGASDRLMLIHARSKPSKASGPSRRARLHYAAYAPTDFLPLFLPRAARELARAGGPCALDARFHSPDRAPAAGGGASGVQVVGSSGQGPASLEGLTILRVEIKGNTRTDARLILDQIRSQQGQAYSLALVDVDNKSIAALDRFVTTRAEVEPVEDDGPPPRKYKGVIVRFIVEERALVNAVEIAGNRKFNNEQIRDGLTVRPGAAVDQFRIETDRKNIIDMYKKKGYAQVSVDVDQTLLNKEGIVRYQIIEGPSTVISKIEFEGNSVLSAAYIKWRIQTKTNLWIFRKGILDEEKLQSDVSAIRDMYLKKAYLDVRVSYVLEYTEDKSKLIVRFVIIEEHALPHRQDDRRRQYRFRRTRASGRYVEVRPRLLCRARQARRPAEARGGCLRA